MRSTRLYWSNTNRAVKLRNLYLGLAVLGLLLPYWQFLPWLLVHGANLALLFQELFANRIAAAFGIDVLLSAVVLLVFVLGEGRRLRMRGLWLPIGGTVLVGVSFALPLFLYMRERQLERGGTI
jgi:Terpene cyclase DEP1